MSNILPSIGAMMTRFFIARRDKRLFSLDKVHARFSDYTRWSHGC
jgi:hypothetical protein